MSPSRENAYNLVVCPSEATKLSLQEAQLSQRDRVMLRVIEYSAKSLKVTQLDSRSFEMTLMSRA